MRDAASTVDLAQALFERHYVAEPTLAEFHADNSLVRGVRGPVGSGKSTAMCMEILARAMRERVYHGERVSKWAVIRNTYPELRSTTIATWTQWVSPQFARITYGAPITCHLRCNHPFGDGTIVDLTILFLALNRPQDTHKLLSLEVTGIWLNEARELPLAVLRHCIRRSGRWPPPEPSGGPLWSGVIMDTNPCNTRHWWYQQAEIVKPDNWRFWHQPPALVRREDGKYAANPSAENVQHHTLGYSYWMRQIPGFTADEIAVYVMGQYGSTFDGRPVYEHAYCDDRHTAERPLGLYKGLPLYLSWDFGLSPACIAGQVSPMGQLRIIREWIGEDIALQQFVTTMVRPALDNEFRGLSIESVGDPAGNQRAQTDEVTPFQVLARHGLRTVAAPTNDFLPRRESVMDYLHRSCGEGDPALLLDPSCTMLREGFLGGYQYARIQVAGEERYRDVPKKDRFSHCIAHGQMVETLRGSVPVEDVRTDDEVRTPIGYRRVLAAWCVAESAEVLRLETDDGRSVVLTGDHLVLANGHWTRADALQYNDILQGMGSDSESIEEVIPWIARANASRRTSTEFGITAYRRIITGPTIGGMERLAICTAMSGSSITDRYPRATKSTTRTATRRTIPSRTLNCEIDSHIIPITSEPAFEIIQNWRCKVLRQPVRRPRNGTHRPLAVSGTANTPSALGLDENAWNDNACGAGRRTQCSVEPSSGDSAHLHARAWREGNLGLTTRTAPASFVANLFAPTSTPRSRPAPRVVRISPLQERISVYDITVEDAHCFYANGILVHNCQDALAYLCCHLQRDRIRETRGHARKEVVHVL